MYSGFLNVNKPSGITSHDVVNQVRRLLRPVDRTLKVGHAGTLDPLADGVLVVCVGDATRLSDYVMQGDKAYQVTMQLGVTTDSYDADGRITQQRSCGHVTQSAIARAAERFVGQIEQRPPVYSAIKVAGRRLYERARAGEVVTPPLRRVRIHRIEVISVSLPYAMLNVDCAPGTYIRSLVHDMGEALACGAHIVSLTRVRSGCFLLRDSVDLAAVAEAAALKPWLVQPAQALSDYPAVTVTLEQIARLRVGMAVPLAHAPGGASVMAFDAANRLVAICDWEEGRLKPRKVFADGAFQQPG